MKKMPSKTTEKYVTEKVFKETSKTFEKRFDEFEERFDEFEERFESSARATAKSFADVNETLKNITKVTEVMLKEIRTIHEDNKYFRQSISNLNINDFSYDRKIEDLTIRVDKLELKAK
ncbi:MAG: hypothetical protein WC822_00235 [Candidatus Paceibacterota bacterium]|jgi:dsDNA-specific endonuclease/ATPase MutS2